MCSVPSYQDLMLPMLKQFNEGKQSVADCIEALIQEFDISEDDAQELLPSGKMTYLNNRAHWARTYMSKAGLLESPKRGVHNITPRGQNVIASGLDYIDNKTLSEFDEFSIWRESSVDSTDWSDPDKSFKAVRSDEAQTPEDTMLSASRLLTNTLRDELIAALLEVTPTRFERLILDLLNSMGFGRGTTGYSQLTPASGDGGIDGIINEDALGLDAVYIQAKRYALHNKVSRPDIQRFVGSLTGESATKGVFVTTSSFSKEARAYIERVQQRVVLIDGRQLADLMISHNVGVRTQNFYEIKAVDEQYFSES